VARALEWLLTALVPRIDYSIKYSGTVIKQNDDGSLEIVFAKAGLKPLSSVAIAYGVPGIAAKINSGGSVVVGFMNQDPAIPYALVFDQASVASISLLGGTMPVARVGDGCVGFMPPTAMYTGTFGTETLTNVPVVMANAFGGVIDGGQEGCSA